MPLKNHHKTPSKTTLKRKSVLFYILWFMLGLGYFLTSTNFTKTAVIKTFNCTVEPYTDSIDGGNSKSEIHLQNESFCYKYTLGSQVRFPFTGVQIQPHKPIDLDDFDYIEYTLLPDSSKSIHTFIYFTYKESRELSIRSELNTKPDKTIYTLPIESFDFPSWYLKGKQINRNEFENFNIQFANSFRLGHDIFVSRDTEDLICVESVKLGVYNSNQIIISILIVVVGFLGQFLFKRLKNVKIEISYKPVEVKQIDYESIEQKEIRSIIAYINENYMNSEITLRSIRKAVKIPENKISLLIRKEFGISYKNYINKLRVEEAKRLFIKTPKVLINEVSDAVGFGGSTTFNKVFKEQTGLTPSQFTESLNN